jgi:hypothetical protein
LAYWIHHPLGAKQVKQVIALGEVIRQVIEQKSAEAIVVACQDGTIRRAERVDKAGLVMLDHRAAAAEVEVMIGVERRTDFE